MPRSKYKATPGSVRPGKTYEVLPQKIKHEKNASLVMTQGLDGMSRVAALATQDAFFSGHSGILNDPSA